MKNLTLIAFLAVILSACNAPSSTSVAAATDSTTTAAADPAPSPSPSPSPTPLFNGGDGTEGAPYIVHTPQQLQNIDQVSSAVGTYYALDSNLDMTGFSWTPIGTTSGNPFEGTLNGQGYTISSLSAPGSSQGVLFGSGIGISGVIENLNINSINASSASGGITGAINGLLTNVHVTQTVLGTCILGDQANPFDITSSSIQCGDLTQMFNTSGDATWN